MMKAIENKPMKPAEFFCSSCEQILLLVCWSVPFRSVVQLEFSQSFSVTLYNELSAASWSYSD